MNNVYVFDVDGTLTRSREKINPDFEEFFLNWMKDKDVILLTGSDRQKTIEQVGERIWNNSYACMQSCGNHIFQKGSEVYRNEWEADSDLLLLLEDFLQQSKFKVRTSNHIEHRIGLLNFSIVGRDCSQAEREQYYRWDNENKERLDFAEEIMNIFPDVEASVGGQISIDIHPLGANKGQAKQWILDKFEDRAVIHFFGDKMLKGGNDYDLAKILEKPHKKYSVRNWNDTYKFLKEIS